MSCILSFISYIDIYTQVMCIVQVWRCFDDYMELNGRFGAWKCITRDELKDEVLKSFEEFEVLEDDRGRE